MAALLFKRLIRFGIAGYLASSFGVAGGPSITKRSISCKSLYPELEYHSEAKLSLVRSRGATTTVAQSHKPQSLRLFLVISANLTSCSRLKTCPVFDNWAQRASTTVEAPLLHSTMHRGFSLSTCFAISTRKSGEAAHPLKRGKGWASESSSLRSI